MMVKKTLAGYCRPGKFDDEHTEYLDVKVLAENEDKIDRCSW